MSTKLLAVLSVLAVLATTFTGSAFAKDVCTCVPECGAPSQPCCTCDMLPADDKCVVFGESQTAWCLTGGSCADGVCETATVLESSAAGCGDAQEPCCDVSWCAAGLTCASGSCINVKDTVIDSSASCCVEGAPCFGADKDCDEGLVCASDVCVNPA